MPIHLSWEDHDKTLLLVESSGQWTWEEYHDALSRMAEMIQNENHRVDIITVSRADSIRPSGSALPHYQSALRILPSNTGLHVIVNTSAIARSIVSIFLRLNGKRTSGMVVLAGSLEDARRQIQNDRTKSLPTAQNGRSG